MFYPTRDKEWASANNLRTALQAERKVERQESRDEAVDTGADHFLEPVQEASVDGKEQTQSNTALRPGAGDLALETGTPEQSDGARASDVSCRGAPDSSCAGGSSVNDVNGSDDNHDADDADQAPGEHYE